MSSVKKKIKALPTIRISQLDDKGIKEVWILNETGNKNTAVTGPKGNIVLEVKNRADGSPTVVTIPPTWVPICLTDQVPKQMLVESPRFRAILSGGYIKLLDPKGVDEILKDPEVRAEIESIRNRTADYYKETLPESIQAEDTTSVVVLDILQREIEGSITESQAKDILNTREDELTEVDLEKLTKDSSLPKVKKWAADVLMDRREDAEEA
jgi:hypothetical protein